MFVAFHLHLVDKCNTDKILNMSPKEGKQTVYRGGEKKNNIESKEFLVTNSRGFLVSYSRVSRLTIYMYIMHFYSPR